MCLMPKINNMRITKNKDGFTLVEMILVVLVSSMIAIAVYRIFAVATKADERVRMRMEAYRSVDTVFYLIENDLSNMVQYSFEGRSLIGDERSIRMFIAADTGVEVVRYFIDAVKRDLVRSQQSMADFLSDQTNGPRIQQTIVSHDTFRNIRFQFGYLNPIDADDPIWKTQWQQKTLPFNVRVRLDAVENKAPDGIISEERIFLIPHGEWGEL